MTDSSNRPVEPPPDDPGNPFADLDAREALFTGALAQAARAEHLAAAIRVQVMQAGFDAMLIEEQAETGRQVRPDDPVVRGFLAHQASVLHVSPQAVERKLEHARILRDGLPDTWQVFLEGRCSEQVAQVAANQSIGLPEHALPEYDAVAAQLVQHQRATVVERELVKLRDRLAPEAAIARAEQQANRRYVTARPEGDGGGVLEIHGTAVDIAAAYDSLRQRGVAAHGRGTECRALGALMADDAIDLLLNGAALDAASAPTPAERADTGHTAGTDRAAGADQTAGADRAAGADQTAGADRVAGSPSYPGERIGDDARPGRKAVQAEILVIVPAETATGAANTPAELAGMGSLDAETARQIIASTRTWTRVLVDPIDDTVLGIDSHDRHIPAGLKKLLHARTPVCTGDDCGLPAHRADGAHGAGSDARPKAACRPCDGDDHIVRNEHDGHTRHDNLQLLCRRSHQAKDTGYLAVRMLPDGSVAWHNKWGGHRIITPALKIRTHTYPDDPPF